MICRAFARECTSSTRTQNGHTGGSDLRASGTDELLGGDPIIRVERSLPGR
jgi:hypothetical protein